VKLLAQTISEIRTKQGVLKLMVGALRPSTAQQSANRKISTGSQASIHGKVACTLSRLMFR